MTFIAGVEEKDEKIILLKAKDLPQWLVDNPYILGWYRKPCLTIKQCIQSVFQIHNQTANIWTHTMGLVLSQYLLFWCFPEYVIEHMDRMILILAHLGIAASFLCSIIYHIFNSSSFEQSRFLSQIDYFGIILHLLLVLIALVYFSAYTILWLQVSYVLFYIIVLIVCLWMNYHCMLSSITKKMNPSQRSWFFIIVAAASIPPSIMVGPLYGWWLVFRIIANDMIYVVAALVYTTKYPEKICPGLFDLFNSHTIFHLFIILAGYQTTISLSILAKFAIEKS